MGSKEKDKLIEASKLYCLYMGLEPNELVPMSHPSGYALLNVPRWETVYKNIESMYFMVKSIKEVFGDTGNDTR